MHIRRPITPPIPPPDCTSRLSSVADANARSGQSPAASSRRLLLFAAVAWQASRVVMSAAIGGAAQTPRTEDEDFSVSVVTDARTDRLGMATVVRAGGQTYYFDCRGVDSATTAVLLANARPAAVFVTNPAWLTEPDFIRVLDGSTGQTPPLRIWGPAGTREWMRRRYPDGAGLRAEWAPTVAEVGGGEVSEAGVHVTAVSVAQDALAYRVVSNGRSVLIASNVTAPAPLESALPGVDMVVLRHSNTPDVLRVLDQTRPQQLWIVPDGSPISVAQVRQSYGGPFEIVTAGLHRSVGPRNASAYLAQQ